MSKRLHALMDIAHDGLCLSDRILFELKESFGLPLLRLRVTVYSENFIVYCENLAVDADT